jgi:hypothetical protein
MDVKYGKESRESSDRNDRARRFLMNAPMAPGTKSANGTGCM